MSLPAGADEELRGRVDAQRFLDRHVDERRIVTQRRRTASLIETEAVEQVADQVAGGVAPGADHEHDLRANRTGFERLAVDLGDEEPGERVLGPLVARQLEPLLDPRVDVAAQLRVQARPS